MNIGEITDRNLNVQWLRNSMILVKAPQVPPILGTLIQVFLFGQASVGAILHRNQIYKSESQLSREA